MGIFEIQIHYPLYLFASSLDPAIPRISQQSFLVHTIIFIVYDIQSLHYT